MKCHGSRATYGTPDPAPWCWNALVMGECYFRPDLSGYIADHLLPLHPLHQSISSRFPTPEMNMAAPGVLPSHAPLQPLPFPWASISEGKQSGENFLPGSGRHGLSSPGVFLADARLWCSPLTMAFLGLIQAIQQGCMGL